jgi:hypothetical protein
MKPKKPTIKQVQAVRCPTCGTGPGEKCELTMESPAQSQIVTPFDSSGLNVE